MPVLISPNISIRPVDPLTGTWDNNFFDTWQYCNLKSVPPEAAALIVRVTSPYSTYAGSASVVEYYGEPEATLNTYQTGAQWLDDNSNQFLIVGYRGAGSIVTYITGEAWGYVPSIQVIGYFTHEEFVNFDDYRTTTYNTGNSFQNYDITGESWYVPEATAYLQGCNTGGAEILTKGWASLTGSYENHSIFWPDGSNEVGLNTQANESVHVPGYFISPIIKGSNRDGRKAIHSEYAPLLDTDSGDFFLHQGRTDFSFAIALREHPWTNTWDRPDMYTRPAHAGSGGTSGNAFFSWGGRGGNEFFILPSQDPGSEGQFYLIFRDYREYNYDAALEYVSFPVTRSVVVESSLSLPDPQFNDPSLVQAVATAVGVPVVYRTVSGEYTWNGTLLMYLSGGSSNADPTLSLGGDISVTAMGGNIFGTITNRKAQLGGPDYRCVYLKNTSGSETAYGLIVWIENQAELGNTVSIGIDPVGKNAAAQSISDEYTDPVGVSFAQPSGEANGLSLGFLSPGDTIAVWFKRDTIVQNARKGAETVTLAFSVSNNG